MRSCVQNILSIICLCLNQIYSYFTIVYIPEFQKNVFRNLNRTDSEWAYLVLSAPDVPIAKYRYSQTCFSDHLSTKATFVVSLENGFSLNHVLKDPVYKDHLSTKATFCVSLGGRYRQV